MKENNRTERRKNYWFAGNWWGNPFLALWCLLPSPILDCYYKWWFLSSPFPLFRGCPPFFVSPDTEKKKKNRLHRHARNERRQCWGFNLLFNKLNLDGPFFAKLSMGQYHWVHACIKHSIFLVKIRRNYFMIFPCHIIYSPYRLKITSFFSALYVQLKRRDYREWCVYF